MTIARTALTLIAAVAVLVVLVRVLEPRLAFFPFRGETTTPRDVGVDYESVTIETSDGERLRAWHIHSPLSTRHSPLCLSELGLWQAHPAPKVGRLLPRQRRQPLELGADRALPSPVRATLCSRSTIAAAASARAGRRERPLPRRHAAVDHSGRG